MKRKIVLAILCVSSLGACIAYSALNWMNKDKEAPVFMMEDNRIETTLEQIKQEPSVLFSGMVAKDNVDGDVTSRILLEKLEKKSENVFKADYVVYDSSSNYKEASRELVIQDYYSPQFYCEHSLRFPEGTKVDLKNYITVKDAIDGDISSKVVYSAPSVLVSGEASVGVYDCSATILNSVYDEKSITFKVEILGNSENTNDFAPEIILSQNNISLEKGQAFDSLNYITGIKDNGTTYQIDRGLMYRYNVEIDSYEPVENIELYNPSELISEKQIQGEEGNWISSSVIGFQSDLDTNKPGEYIAQYWYTSPTTGFTTSATIHIVVR
ncbi:MAG: hypothetical protein KBT48_10880 [Firmicutes bacterium]|nr:hypothetical protein [Bacillota bacterium]